MSILLLFLVVTVYLLTRTINIRSAVMIFWLQSFIIACFCIAAGLENKELHVFIAALLTLFVKVYWIPRIMLRVTGRTKMKEDSTALGANYTSLAFGGCLVISYAAVGHFLPDILNSDALAVALALFLMGMTFIIVRRQALMQIIGLMTMENGLYLLGLSVTKGMPVIIEFGILLDVLFVAVILGFLTKKIRLSFATTDVGELTGLKE